VNLWLSPHCIWYYRKVTVLPCGRRKNVKKSLRTRDRLVSREKLGRFSNTRTVSWWHRECVPPSFIFSPLLPATPRRMCRCTRWRSMPVAL